MKSKSFVYERPTTVQDALGLKLKWGPLAQFLAGGQSLLPALNLRLNQSECLIDLNRVAGLSQISVSDGHLHIGAMVRHSDVISSTLVAEHAPLLVDAGRFLAHAAIRNRGTFGGSLALADPAAEWPAACLLLDADIEAEGPTGSFVYPAAEFFKGFYETALANDQILTAIRLPVRRPSQHFYVTELARRYGDFATAAIMAKAEKAGERFESISVVLFGVSDRPLICQEVNEIVLNACNAQDTANCAQPLGRALEQITLRADLYHSVEAKRHLCAVLIQRCMDSFIQP
jgi:carbon-monoxide dehydrogenase medium subunit